MKRIIGGIALIAALAFVGTVSEAKPKAKPELKEATLTGTITKEETQKGEKTIVSYVLTDDNGTGMRLEKTKGIELEDFVDQKVKVVAKVSETVKGDKTVVKIVKLISVKKADEAEAVEEPDAGGIEEPPVEELPDLGGGDDNWNF